MYLLKLFRPIIIIDNVHKCSFENMILKNTFETIITAKTNRIYFIGWFNIFPKTVNIKNNRNYSEPPLFKDEIRVT